MTLLSMKRQLFHECCRNGFTRRLKQVQALSAQPYSYMDIDEKRQTRNFSSIALSNRKADGRPSCRSKYPPYKLHMIQERSYGSHVIEGMVSVGSYCFTTVHSLTGAPWWLSIIILVVPFRTAFQITREVYARRNIKRLSQVYGLIGMKIGSHLHQYKDAPKKDQEEQMLECHFLAKMWRRELYQIHKCHPFAPIVFSCLHIPIWLTMSFSLRAMAGTRILGFEVGGDYFDPSLGTEGTLWFSNMLLPDPFSILPIVAGLSILTSIEISILRQMRPNIETNKDQLDKAIIGNRDPIAVKFLIFISRVFAIGIMCYGHFFPAAVPYYWCISTLSANAVTLALVNPKVLKLLRIEPMPHDSQTPYQDIYSAMKMRYIVNPRNFLNKLSTSKLMVKSNKDEGKDGKEEK